MAEQENIADMSRHELRAFIEEVIQERLREWPLHAQRTGSATPQAWQRLLDNIIEPADDEPSALDMLREEREQWSSM